MHGPAQRDLYHEQRKDQRANQRDRDVQRWEREQHMLAENVLSQRDEAVGEAEAEWDADRPAGERDR